MHYSKVCMHSKGKRVAKSYKGHGKNNATEPLCFHQKWNTSKSQQTGEQRKVVHKPRIYEKTFPDSESVTAKTRDKLVAHRAQVSARQLQELVKLFGSETQPKCRFRCQ